MTDEKQEEVNELLSTIRFFTRIPFANYRISFKSLPGGSHPTILPVDESYKRDQPIEFSHDIHAGKNQIDCKFCHNTEFDEKNTGIPSADVCMKCQKEVKGNPTQGTGK